MAPENPTSTDDDGDDSAAASSSEGAECGLSNNNDGRKTMMKTSNSEMEEENSEMEEENDDDDDDDDVKYRLNLGALHGMRCLTCFAVVLLHVHVVFGGWFLPSTEPCMRHLAHFPVLGPLLLNPSGKMTTFWMMSGFLCEYQLHRGLLFVLLQRRRRQQQQQRPSTTTTTDGEEGWTSSLSTAHYYVRFLLNRCLRLYPMYALYVALMLFRPELKEMVGLFGASPAGEEGRRDDAPPGGGGGCEWPDALRALAFRLQPNGNDPPRCAGPGWTLSVDVHGYLVTVLAFALTCRYTYGRTAANNNNNQWTAADVKQAFFCLWYAASIAYMMTSLRPRPEQWLDGEALRVWNGESARMGIDLMSEANARLFDFANVGLRQLYGDGGASFDSPAVAAIRDFLSHHRRNIYYTGLTRHGSAYVLGSVLYTNVHRRRGKPSRSPWKLLACVFIMVTTKAVYMLSGISTYLLLDVILTLDTTNNVDSKNRSISTKLSTATIQFLSHPFFEALAPYTYGIYMYHLIYLIIRSGSLAPLRARAIRSGVDACRAAVTYDWRFVLTETASAVCCTLIATAFLHHVLQLPVDRLRRRLLGGTSSEKIKTH